jgi:nucleotide-binding universal stress UspA family protein
MFKRILIPIDSSKSSEQAARLALGFAKGIGASALVMHVAYRQVLLDLESDGLERTAYLRYGQRLLEPWNEIGTKHEVKLETKLVEAEGLGIAESIIRTAASEACDLIVMGTQGREGLERLLLGSVAERVVRLSDVPVMLVRQAAGTPARTGFTRVLVPVDGSDASGKALWTANEIAVRLGAELEFVHIIPDVPLTMADPVGVGGLVYDYEGWAEALEQEGERVIANAKATATAQKVHASKLRASGRRIAEVIVQAARTGGADLIVMGTHGRGGFDRLLLGSVAEGVAHHADVPVLLVRSPDGKPVRSPDGKKA